MSIIFLHTWSVPEDSDPEGRRARRSKVPHHEPWAPRVRPGSFLPGGGRPWGHGRLQRRWDGMPRLDWRLSWRLDGESTRQQTVHSDSLRGALRGAGNASGNLQPRGVAGAGVGLWGLEVRSSAEALPTLPDQRLPHLCSQSQSVWLIHSTLWWLKKYVLPFWLRQVRAQWKARKLREVKRQYIGQPGSCEAAKPQGHTG